MGCLRCPHREPVEVGMASQPLEVGVSIAGLLVDADGQWVEVGASTES